MILRRKMGSLQVKGIEMWQRMATNSLYRKIVTPDMSALKITIRGVYEMYSSL